VLRRTMALANQVNLHEFWPHVEFFFPASIAIRAWRRLATNSVRPSSRHKPANRLLFRSPCGNEIEMASEGVPPRRPSAPSFQLSAPPNQIRSEPFLPSANPPQTAIGRGVHDVAAGVSDPEYRIIVSSRGTAKNLERRMCVNHRRLAPMWASVDPPRTHQGASSELVASECP